jgi:HemY protein
MRWILKLSLYLSLAVAVAFLGYLLRRDAGLVYLRFQGWEIQTSVVFVLLAALGFGVLAIALYVLLVRWPRRWTGWRRGRASARLDQGLVLAQQDRLYDALRELLAASAQPAQRLSALLVAAQVANRRGEYGLVEEILRNAGELERGRDIAPLLSEVWRAQRGEEAARRAVATRAAATEAPPLVLRVQLEDALAHARAAEALSLLERLKAARQIGDREIAQLERRVQILALSQAATREDLTAIWKRFAREERRDPAVLEALLQSEARVGGEGLAAEAIEQALAKDFAERLAELYAAVPVAELSVRIRKAEALLANNPQSPGLLRALAHFCRLGGLPGKALDYIRQALSWSVTPATLVEYARIAGEHGDEERACLAWRLAAECALGSPPRSEDLTRLLRG